MIRDPENDASTITVYLLNGTVYKNKDIPSQPITNGMVAFWHNNKITAIPLHLVERIVVTNET